MTKRYRPSVKTEYDWYVKYESHNVTAKQLHNVTEKNKKLKARIVELEEELKNLKNRETI